MTDAYPMQCLKVSKELKENIVLMNKMENILLTVVKHAASQGFWLKK